MASPRVIHADHLLDVLKRATAPTLDEVTIDEDAERIDTAEKMRALIARENAKRASEALAAGHDGDETDDDRPRLDVVTLIHVLDQHEVDVIVVGGVVRAAYEGTKDRAALPEPEELAARHRRAGARSGDELG